MNQHHTLKLVQPYFDAVKRAAISAALQAMEHTQ
jgi:hypothetical protein